MTFFSESDDYRERSLNIQMSQVNKDKQYYDNIAYAALISTHNNKTCCLAALYILHKRQSLQFIYMFPNFLLSVGVPILCDAYFVASARSTRTIHCCAV